MPHPLDSLDTADVTSTVAGVVRFQHRVILLPEERFDLTRPVEFFGPETLRVVGLVLERKFTPGVSQHQGATFDLNGNTAGPKRPNMLVDEWEVILRNHRTGRLCPNPIDARWITHPEDKARINELIPRYTLPALAHISFA